MSASGDRLREIVLQVIRHCPQCHQPFDPKDVDFLGRMGETWFLSLHCRHCHILAVVGLSLASPGELTPEEVARWLQTPPVDVDDVLEMHRFLEGFDGDFRRLFSGDRPETEEAPPR